MGCCGRKRREFRQERNNSPPSHFEPSLPDSSQPSPVSFEYTGKRSLKVRGSFSGTTYYFRFPGHRLDVIYEDSFALMAEKDLKVNLNFQGK